nr:hypothetical protein BaRGS_001515 [Batillaria attramentaria]
MGRLLPHNRDSRVDLAYRRITSLPYTIHISLHKLIIAEDADSSHWTEQHRVTTPQSRDQVRANLVLVSLTDWADTTPAVLSSGWDHIILFTE